jgi:hypothetical protein
MRTRIGFPYVSEMRAEGRAEGQAESIVKVLGRRSVSMTDEDRERILGCGDVATLDVWLDRALMISVIDDLFAPIE